MSNNNRDVAESEDGRDEDDVGINDSGDDDDDDAIKTDSQPPKTVIDNQKDARRRLEEKLDAVRLDRSIREYDFRDR